MSDSFEEREKQTTKKAQKMRGVTFCNSSDSEDSSCDVVVLNDKRKTKMTPKILCPQKTPLIDLVSDDEEQETETDFYVEENVIPVYTIDEEEEQDLVETNTDIEVAEQFESQELAKSQQHLDVETIVALLHGEEYSTENATGEKQDPMPSTSKSKQTSTYQYKIKTMPVDKAMISNKVCYKKGPEIIQPKPMTTGGHYRNKRQGKQQTLRGAVQQLAGHRLRTPGGGSDLVKRDSDLLEATKGNKQPYRPVKVNRKASQRKSNDNSDKEQQSPIESKEISFGNRKSSQVYQKCESRSDKLLQTMLETQGQGRQFGTKRKTSTNEILLPPNKRFR